MRDLPGRQPPQALVALIMITHLCPPYSHPPFIEPATCHPIFGTCAIIPSEPRPQLMPCHSGYSTYPAPLYFAHRHHSYSLAFPRRWQCMESIVRCIPHPRGRPCARVPAMAFDLLLPAGRQQLLLPRPARELLPNTPCCLLPSRQPVGQDDGLNGGRARLPIFSTVESGSAISPRNRLVLRMLEERWAGPSTDLC